MQYLPTREMPGHISQSQERPLSQAANHISFPGRLPPEELARFSRICTLCFEINDVSYYLSVLNIYLGMQQYRSLKGDRGLLVFRRP